MVITPPSHIYIPHVKQKAFHVSRARYRNVCAGRRAGKSKAAGREFLASIVRDLQQPEVREAGDAAPLLYWAVAPIDELTTIQVREVEAAGRQYHIRMDHHKGEKTITIPGWPVEIQFRSAFNPKMLVGQDVYGVWMDEAAKCHPDAWGYIEPSLTATAGWVITSTTPEGYNWYYKEFWTRGESGENEDPRYANFHFESADNPFLARICPKCVQSYRVFSAPWLKNRCPSDNVELIPEAIYKKALLPARIYDREYRAFFDAFKGQVYTELDKHLHWSACPGNWKWKRLIGGQDWNYALPGAFVLLGEDWKGNWWILDEIYQERLPVWDDQGDCWVRRIQALVAVWEKRLKVPLERIWCDPAQPEHIETERKKGLPTRAADNSVAMGIQTVAVLLHPIVAQGPRLRFWAEPRDMGVGLSPLARNTWNHLVSYQYQEGTEQPLKKDDHLCDAVRYGVHSTVGRDIGRVGMQPGRLI